MERENCFVLRSRQVFTGCTDGPSAASIVIKEGRIQKVLPWNYGKTGNEYKDIPLYDYGEKLVMPSFVDAHTHIFSGAVNASSFVCDTLGECSSQKECVDMIRQYAQDHPELRRIRGAGWFIGKWPEKILPDKKSLDEVIPDKPVYLMCADCHSMWLNSMALKEAGITEDYTVENGQVCRFDNGELTGLLIEPEAYRPGEEKYMDFSEDEMYQIYEEFQKILVRYGIAAVSEMFGYDYTEEMFERYDILKKLDEQQKMKSDVYIYTRLSGNDHFDAYKKMKKYFQTPHIHIAGMKGFLDGVTETHTGLLLEPYTDRPDTCGEGVPLWPKEKMQEEIIAANRQQIQVRLHCIADGSVRMALDMYEESRKYTDISKLRNTIEHIENIHPEDIDRFSELGVVPSMQPAHLTMADDDGKMLQIGPERCRYGWPLNTLWERNGSVALGTDYPVVSINPFLTIYAAATRKNEDGKKIGNNPWEVLSMSKILRAYTIEAAKVYHAEQEIGTLEEGKKANLIVLSQNLFEVEENEIRNTAVEVNYFEGKPQ